MFKKLFTILVVLLFTASINMAQWDYAGAFPDTNYKGGTHGIAVSPDGKVWQSSYYSSSWVSPDGDTLSGLTPIYVFNSDGSLLDIIGTVTTGEGFLQVTDTLTGSCRGLAADADGNIIYAQSGDNTLFKIDYMTLEGMAKHETAGEHGSSPAGPATDANGNIYVGPVVSGLDTEISIYDTDLNYLGAAVPDPGAIARNFEVSADGNTIYWTVFTGDPIQMRIYSRPDEFSEYALEDTVLQGMSIESAALDPVSGNLWVSNDNRGDGTGIYGHLTWYEYDVTADALVDSFKLPFDWEGTTDQLPRGLAFSPDGMYAYVGLFGTKWDRVYKFDKVTGIAQEFGFVADSYELSQNYPNPFNPTTTISFTIPEASDVTLKVYDMIGQEVATLVNSELSAGKFNVQFDASNLASGTYVYELRAGKTVISNKMMLLK